MREVPILIVVALLVSLIVKTFLFQAFYIPSQSMEQTLLKNDRVIVNKIGNRVFGIDRGQIVVFKDPGGWLSEVSSESGGWLSRSLVAVGLAPDPATGYLIKRAIGLPGDRVQCCSENGSLIVNGELIYEPYVYPENKPSLMTFDVTVPEGSLWVMGDHRENSEDSRYHQDDGRGGMVPLTNVLGRASLLMWPLDRFRLLN